MIKVIGIENNVSLMGNCSRK